MPTPINSKETILQRLFHRAASLWDIQSIEDLDPVVKIMMEGLSTYLYDLTNEIEDSSVRILEAVAATLVPSILINPRPAHAVLQAYPSDSVAIIDRKTVFLDKKIPPELKKRGINFFSFVPVNNRVRLVSGKIKYLITERFFCRIEENGEKAGVTQTHTPSERINNSVWIALDLDPEAETFKNLSFYIDFPFSAGRYDKFKVLPYSRWSVDGQKLEMKTGLPHLSDEDEAYDSEGYDTLFDKYSMLNQIDDTISDYYGLQYLTVNNDLQLNQVNKAKFPHEIVDLFPERVTDLPEPCYWIKAELPVYLKAKDIHDIKIYINTFPVVNKTLYSPMYNLSKTVSTILPLRTHETEHFISVESVTDSHRVEYKAIPYSTKEKPKTGFYSVKRGGMERFDRRDAAEHLERTIDLLRDNVASFLSFGADSLRNVIFEVQENLNRIVQKFEDSRIIEYTVPYYLILDKIENNETIFAEFWATHCEQANNLRTGKMLTPLSNALFRKDSCKLLTQTRGGRAEADTSGKLDAFRYVLTTRDQIMTFEDVSNFCKMELGEKITRVNVTRGVAVSPLPKEGLIRTVDVHLRPTPGYEQVVMESECDLLVALHRKSPDMFNYRIILENK